VFDHTFDDAVWSLSWLDLPLAQPPPGRHPGGWRIEAVSVRDAVVFGRAVRLSVAVDCRVLYGPDGRLWMSSLPQELAMMHAAARRARGRVLVGGLGLAVYPQYAAAVGAAEAFTIVERSPTVAAIVGPTVPRSVPVPVELVLGDVASYLAGPPRTLFDTVYLDVWDTVDPARLPEVNHLRMLAERHLATGGRVFVWGYTWMLRLAEAAARQLLAVDPARRRAWLATQREGARALLAPLLERLEHSALPKEAAALTWFRTYVQQVGATPAGVIPSGARNLDRRGQHRRTMLTHRVCSTPPPRPMSS
jgi:spermidine synthase